MVSAEDTAISLWGGGTPDQLKSKVARPVQIFIFEERRGGSPDQHSRNT